MVLLVQHLQIGGAYKYEVNDAIPYNASIYDERRRKVSINSDDAEMSDV